MVLKVEESLSNEEIRLSVDNYIKQYKTLEKIKKNDNLLYQSLRKKGVSLIDITKELGYEWLDVHSRYPKGYFSNIDNVLNAVRKFINNNDRFPSANELQRELRINYKYIRLHGGIIKIKELLNYDTSEDYVDDNGSPNISLAEYMTAQFLIANKVEHLREIRPFKDTRHRCDFYLESINGVKFYVEVWGYNENQKCKRSTEYLANKRAKLSKYKESNLNLIEIDGTFLSSVKYKDAQNYLVDKFSCIRDYKFITFDDTTYLHPSKLTNEDLCEILLSYGENGRLPTYERLKELSLTKYIVEARKRFNTYPEFAQIMNLEMNTPYWIWNKEKAYVTCKEIVVNGEVLSKNILCEKGFAGLVSYIGREYNNKFTTFKIEFYDKYFSENLISVNNEDIRTLYNYSKGHTNSSEKLSKEDKELACKIVEKIKNTVHYNQLMAIMEEEDFRYTPKLDLQKRYYLNYLANLNWSGTQLYPKYFNDNAEFTTKSILKTFKCNWFEVMGLIGKREDLENTIINDFVENGNNSLAKYISELGFSITRFPDDLKNLMWNKVNSNKTKVKDLDELENNFRKIVNDVGYVPLGIEFERLSKRKIHTYSKHLKIKNNYDEIVRYYCFEDVFEDYLKRKKEHKSNMGKLAGGLSRKHSEDDLKNEYIKAYHLHIEKFGKEPTSRTFKEVSKIDERTYRKRLGIKFSELPKYYGLI